MGLFDRFKRTRGVPQSIEPVMRSLPEPVEPALEIQIPPSVPAPGPAELRRLLFDAVATGDEDKLARLCRDHQDFLILYADTWSIVPDALITNPDAARWYGDGLHAIAHFCAERLQLPAMQDCLRRVEAGRETEEARALSDAYAA